MDLTLSADTVAEMKAELIKTAEVFGLKLVEGGPLSLPVHADKPHVQDLTPSFLSANLGNPVSQPSSEGTAEKRPVGRPVGSTKKPQAPALAVSEASVQSAPVDSAPPTPASTLTKDDVKNALMEVITKKGAEMAKQIVAQFDCTALSQIQPEDYVKAVAACKKALLN